VAIEFSIENVRYEQDGENVFDFQFTVESIQYLDSKAEAERRQTKNEAAAGATSATADHPFNG
jgi:hypothetical protein